MTHFDQWVVVLMMKHLKKSMALGVCGLGLGLMSGCGGGSADTPQVTPPAPVVKLAGLDAQLLTGNKARLVITPGTDTTSYCVRTDANTPTAGDSCFVSQTTQEVATTGSATQATSVRLWTKTSAGVVSLHKALSLPGKTCSAEAYAASTASSLPTACLITDSGELVMALENTQAPGTVKNFLRYVNEGFYNGTHVHRVSSNFVVQGGGFVFNGTNYVKKSPTYASIALEPVATTGLSNTQYTVAMARSTALDSASTEFFINLVNNTSLNTTNGGYAVFGRVIFGQTTTLATMAKVVVKSSTILAPEISQPVTPLALQWAYQIQ
jgi:peptidyl-prolyl cis-trans isomerase A (cyclophilin A)